METQLRYLTKRNVELGSLLLENVTETVWPADVGMYCDNMTNA